MHKIREILCAICALSSQILHSQPPQKPQIEDILKHTDVLKELKGKQEQRGKITNAPSAIPTASGMTQSEAYLRTMFNHDYPSNLDFCLDTLLYYAYAPNEKWATLKPILIKMLDNEKANASDYVFYHAYKKELGIVFDIYTELSNLLNISAGADQALIMRDIMKPRGYKYNNAQEFLDFWPTTQFYKDQITARKKLPDDAYLGGWNDSKDPLRSLVLSVNISLFGNAGDSLASSLYYFVHSESFSATSDILARFLKIWRFKESYLEQLNALEPLIAGGDSGHMLQIFIPRDQVNKLVYISSIYGLPFPSMITNTFDPQKKRHTDALSVLDLYKNNPSSIVTADGTKYYEDYLGDMYYPDETQNTQADDGNYSNDMHPNFINTANTFSLDEIQARILLLPELFDPQSNIKIYRFSTNPETNLPEYKKRLKTIVRNMLIDWLKDPSNKEYLKKLNTPLIKLINTIQAGPIDS